MNLTSEEKQLIQKHRKEKQYNTPQKKGILKHNLYYLPEDFKVLWGFYSEEHKNMMGQQYLNSLTLIPKGTEFRAYVNRDGSEDWYDYVNDRVGNWSADWAKNNLEQITKIKRSSARAS